MACILEPLFQFQVLQIIYNPHFQLIVVYSVSTFPFQKVVLSCISMLNHPIAKLLFSICFSQKRTFHKSQNSTQRLYAIQNKKPADATTCNRITIFFIFDFE